MGNSKTIPLARGLIGGEATVIHGQLEVFLTNYNKVNITMKRKIYSGRRDIRFSIPCADLQDLIDILSEAKDKADSYWLSRVATTELKAR
jgi:hypothetical protein